MVSIQIQNNLPHDRYYDQIRMNKLINHFQNVVFEPAKSTRVYLIHTHVPEAMNLINLINSEPWLSSDD